MGDEAAVEVEEANKGVEADAIWGERPIANGIVFGGGWDGVLEFALVKAFGDVRVEIVEAGKAGKVTGASDFRKELRGRWVVEGGGREKGGRGIAEERFGWLVTKFSGKGG